MVSRAILNGWPLVPPCKPVSSPVFTVQPSISGTFTVGETLTASPGTVTGFPTPTLFYRWLRNGDNTGSTSPTYVLTNADLGARIDLVVTAINVRGVAIGYVTGQTVTASTEPVAPAGFVLLIDNDGAYLVDNDGAYLMEAA